MTKKNPGPLPSGEPRWSFEPDVPTLDMLETYDLTDMGCVSMVLDDLVSTLEQKEFQTWEAVIREEQGLPLSDLHRQLLDDLLDFSDDPEEERILYINEMPRPHEPWYVTVRKVVPHLLVEPFRTFDIHYEEVTQGWPRLAEALQEHGEGLSLPPGATSPIEVVPAELRHKLDLQWSFDALSGLGQEAELTLQNPEERWRIEEFAENLRQCKASVEFFELTLDKLWDHLVLPDADRPLFVQLMQEHLGLSSTRDPLAPHL